MMMTPSTTRPRRAAGFTLAELLVAMFILSLGLVGVASVLYVAGTFQRLTFDDVTARQVARNAESLLRGRALDHDDLDFYHTTPDERSVRPLPIDAQGRLLGKWTLSDRSYPGLGADNEPRDVLERSFYWLPLVRDAAGDEDSPEWQFFVFVLRRDGGEYLKSADPDMGGLTWANDDDPDPVPGVAGIAIDSYGSSRFEFNNRLFADTPVGEADQIQPGDWVVDNNGVIYSVLEADDQGIAIDGFISPSPDEPEMLWYAPPAGPGRDSPASRLIILSDSDLVREP